jgi:hypothetical protein
LTSGINREEERTATLQKLVDTFSTELELMEDTITEWKGGLCERDWMKRKSQQNLAKFAKYGEEEVFQIWRLCQGKMSVLHKSIQLMMDRIEDECSNHEGWLQLYKCAA